MRSFKSSNTSPWDISEQIISNTLRNLSLDELEIQDKIGDACMRYEIKIRYFTENYKSFSNQKVDTSLYFWYLCWVNTKKCISHIDKLSTIHSQPSLSEEKKMTFCNCSIVQYLSVTNKDFKIWEMLKRDFKFLHEVIIVSGERGGSVSSVSLCTYKGLFSFFFWKWLYF